MSKITPKNLSYDNTLPPFLQRLQAHNTSLDDRQEFSVARPKKARNAEEEAEDEPVYFDEESGETLTKSEWEAREKEKEDEKGTKEAGERVGGGNGPKDVKEKEKVTAIGVVRKRKLGKIVGVEDEDEGDEEPVNSRTKTGNPTTSKDPKPSRATTDGKKSEKSKTAKKEKKIKLSFDD